MRERESFEIEKDKEKRRKTLRMLGKAALFGLAAGALVKGAAVGNSGMGKKPENEKQYREEIDRYLIGKEQVSVHYSEDGTTISFVEYGDTRYSLEDTDNDTYIENGSVVRGGRVAEFSENDGVPIDGAERLLSHKLNSGQ